MATIRQAHNHQLVCSDGSQTIPNACQRSSNRSEQAEQGSEASPPIESILTIGQRNYGYLAATVYTVYLMTNGVTEAGEWQMQESTKQNTAEGCWIRAVEKKSRRK